MQYLQTLQNQLTETKVVIIIKTNMKRVSRDKIHKIEEPIIMKHLKPVTKMEGESK